MEKQIELLGIRIDNYTVRESLLRLDTYISNNVLNIIKTVSIDQLIMSVEDQKVREGIRQADLTIAKEPEILTETGCESVQRIRETQDNDFLLESIRRIVKNKKKIFMIADSREELDKMATFFSQVHPDFHVEGSRSIQEFSTDLDALINEINGADPGIILSAVSSPMEEELLLGHKSKITATVWYSLGNQYARNYGGFQLGNFFGRYIKRIKLQQTVKKYELETGVLK